MKLLFIFLLCYSLNFAQKDSTKLHRNLNDGLISLPELNVLYRGFDNVVSFEVKKEYDTLIIQADGVSVRYLEKNKVVINAGNVKTCSLSLISISKGDTILHGNFEYAVLPIPNPTIYIDDKDLTSFDLNNLSNDEFYSLNRIYAKYGNEIPLKVGFLILSFQISINDKIENFEGQELNAELKDKIKGMKKGQIFILKSVRVKGPLKFDKLIELNKYYIKKK